MIVEGARGSCIIVSL